MKYLNSFFTVALVVMSSTFILSCNKDDSQYKPNDNIQQQPQEPNLEEQQTPVLGEGELPTPELNNPGENQPSLEGGEVSGQEIADPTPNPICKVSFESNGGSQVIQQTHKGGTKAIAPVRLPAKKGFAFAGFYWDADLTVSYDFKQDLISDITIYAKWEPITMTTLQAMHDYMSILKGSNIISPMHNIELTQFLTRAQGILNGTNSPSRLESAYNDLANLLATCTLTK